MDEWLTRLPTATVYAVAIVSSFASGMLGLIAAIPCERKAASRVGVIVILTVIAVSGNMCLLLRGMRNDKVHEEETSCIHNGVAALSSTISSYTPTSPVNQRIKDATEFLMRSRNCWPRQYCELTNGLLMLMASQKNGSADTFVFISNRDIPTICKNPEFFQVEDLTPYLFSPNPFWADDFHYELEMFNAFVQTVSEYLEVCCEEYTCWEMADEGDSVVYSFQEADKEWKLARADMDELRSLSRFELQCYIMNLLREEQMEALSRYLVYE